MKETSTFSRRAVVKSSVFGLLGISIPNMIHATHAFSHNEQNVSAENLFHRYPSIDDEIVSEVVGKSHFNLDRVKELVDKRTELARATWDWGFGDWETAIGAASHVGRRDIVFYLLSKGARPDIFTYAMLGNFEAVKAMIEATPGVQSIAGPHGISLLSHAMIGRGNKNFPESQIEKMDQLIQYLEDLGDATDNRKFIEVVDKDKYLGDYMYGDGPKDGFSIKLNMRDMIALGKLGQFGGGLNQIEENVFLYNGITSVKISFQWEGDTVKSLTVVEPDLTLVANKI